MITKQYYGFDWTELCETFHVPSWDGTYLHAFLSSVRYDTRLERKVAAEIRAFCKQLGEAEMYDSGIWKAISEIEHDNTVLQYFEVLCEYAWC